MYEITDKGKDRLEFLDMLREKEEGAGSTVDAVILLAVSSDRLEELKSKTIDRGSRQILITRLNSLERSGYIEEY